MIFLRQYAIILLFLLICLPPSLPVQAQAQGTKAVRIMTDPPGAYMYRRKGERLNYIGQGSSSLPVFLESNNDRLEIIFVKDKAMMAEELKGSSRLGFDVKSLTIEPGYFSTHDVYPPSGSIKLYTRRQTWLWLSLGLAVLIAAALAFFLSLSLKKRRALLGAPDKFAEPATVTEHDLTGFGGQVGDIRGKRLIGRYGTYLVKKVMGEGGMSIVYEAISEQAGNGKGGEKCAVKVVLPSVARSPEYNERFHREIEVYHRLVHPSIVQIYDWGDEEGVLFIVMEKIEGKPLNDVILEKRPPLHQSIIWTLQTLKALSYAHERRIVHRDIKPSNIFITTGGNVKVLDFGIARALDAKTITGTDVALGTPQYLPPEQIDSKSVDQRADLYSLGVMLFQLIAGTLPFSGGTAYELIIRQMTEVPPPPSKINEEVSPALDAVVMRLLEKQPDDRYSTARDAAEALGRAAFEAGLIGKMELDRWLQ